MLSSQVKFSADRQTDRQMDTGKNNMLLIYRCGGIKINKRKQSSELLSCVMLQN